MANVQKKSFVRKRKLPFKTVLALILEKTVKSLQIKLNEFMEKHSMETVTNSAFCQARQKLLHTAFIEMNQKTIVDVMYSEEEEHLRYKGMRLIAIDGSRIRLPESKSIREEYGTTRYRNQDGAQGEHPTATASVCYDVLNNIAIDSVLGKKLCYEGDLAEHHLPYLQKGDLVVCDRNYQSYVFMAHLVKRGINFLIRGGKNKYACVKQMFNSKEKSKLISLDVCKQLKSRVVKLGLPTQINIRLIRVTLDTGETEILITTLLDHRKFPYRIFKDLYFQRWKIETFYDVLKNRLELTHFSGITAESVRQDFYAAVFISGLESILTEDADEILIEKSLSNKHLRKINKNISFNAIKNRVCEILDRNYDTDLLMEKLTTLFLTAPTPIRDLREVARRKPRARSQIHYYRCKKKRSY